MSTNQVLLGKLYTMLLLSFGLTGLYAQETITTAGGNASSSEGKVTYTVGQVTYQNYPGTTVSIAEGVQQPFEISVAAAIEEADEINLSMMVHPNPTTDVLILNIGKSVISDLWYQLFDAQGKLLEYKKIVSTRTNIATSKLVPSTYLLKVIQDSEAVKTFKIIKK